MFGPSTSNDDDFILALAAVNTLGQERRARSREDARTRTSVERLAHQYRAALGRIADLEAQLKRERAARLAAEMNLERRS
ncbi:MAG: hypothetical protein CML24_02135 [Rhizobiales bacterium]|nr:hypothetical protein [Hyphomicrobiales bacterium]|tara:strand:- start:9465 stop:9704 length:240 start_codon:yes stop_codon:yes gene_type:complete